MSDPSTIEVTVQPVGATAQADNTTSCSGLAVNLSSNPTGGTPFTFSWSNGTTVIGTTEDLTVNPTATTTFTVTVTDVCSNSIQSSVTVTVNPLPTAAIAETGPISLCQPATQTLTAVTNAASPSYSWSRNGEVIPGATGATYVVSESGSYTLRVTDDATNCASVFSAAVSVTINPVPATLSVAPSPLNVCENVPGLLTASGGITNISAVLGAGDLTTTGNTTTSTLGPNPFQNYYGGTKQQMLFRVAELQSLGMSAGSRITSLGINMVTVGGTTDPSIKKVKVKAQHTALNVLTSSMVTTGWTNLFGFNSDVTITPVVGINTVDFDNDFVWNGTSNLLIEMNYSNQNSGNGGTNTASYNSTSFASTTFYRVDGTTQDLNAYTGSATNLLSFRNDVTFNFVTLPSTTWTPIEGLYTDAAGTVAYSGTPTPTVYAKPAAGNYVYTAKATGIAGCFVEAAVEVNVTPALTVSADITGPTNPGAHIGNGSPVATYVITADNYSNITWTIPVGATNVSGQGTTSISFNYPVGYTTGTISVTVDGNSPCGSITRTLNLTCDAPSAPVVSGPVNVCTYVGTG
ncbi:MAG: hypothetical protein EOP49_28195, partial [Sphingobacteriales bacterium]